MACREAGIANGEDDTWVLESVNLVPEQSRRYACIDPLLRDSSRIYFLIYRRRAEYRDVDRTPVHHLNNHREL